MDNIDNVTDLKLSEKAEKKICRCTICGYQTQNVSHFRRHQKIHLEPQERQLFPCAYCNNKYKTKPSLQYHLESNHTNPRDRKRSQKAEKVCRCSICGYQTQNMSYFKRHKKIHLAPEERQLFACTHCGQKYITKPGLKRHLVDNHIDFRAKRLKKSQKKVYRCAACGYQTPHRSDFRKHQIIHLAPEERQMFACMCCDKKYTSNQALRNHIIRDHIDSRNADCISLTEEVIVDSLKMEIDDHAPFLNEFGNAGCLSATNDVKLEDFLKIEPDVAPILNKDRHDDFKNTEDLSVNKEVKLEDFIKMEPDDGAAFLDEESRF